MKILDALKSKPDAILGYGVTKTDIDNAEKALGLRFAPDYKEYLLTVGLAMCDGHEFTGIGKSARNNVVNVTLEMKRFCVGIPDDWYVIENENMDGCIIWQNSTGEIYFNRRKEYDSFCGLILDL